MNNALINTSVGYPVHGWSQGVCGTPVENNPTPWWFWVALAVVTIGGRKGRTTK